MAEKSGGLPLKIVVGVLVVGGIFGWKFYNKSQASGEAKAAAVSWMSNMPCYAGNQVYLHGLLSEFHDDVFDEC